MTGHAVDCSVLVPVRDEERYIEATLQAMRAQRFDGTLEFIFADGASVDRTREILEAAAREDSRIRIFDNPRQTVPSALNVALREAGGRWVARMDAHTRYPPDYLARGVARLQDGDSRWVSGPPVPEGGDRMSRAVALALGTRLGRSGSLKWAADADQAAAAPEYELDSGVFCGVWERETLLQYGGWDERWRVNEDSEMAARFLACGERLVCVPAMAATYAPRGSVSGLWRQYYVYGQYRARTARRHPDAMRRQHLVAPALAMTAAAAVTGPRWPGRRLARLGISAYGAALAREGLSCRRFADRQVEAALVPAALATMHLAWGAGTIVGMARFGPPSSSAVRRLLGLGRPSAPRPAPQEPVWHPSLLGS